MLSEDEIKANVAAVTKSFSDERDLNKTASQMKASDDAAARALGSLAVHALLCLTAIAQAAAKASSAGKLL